MVRALATALVVFTFPEESPARQLPVPECVRLSGSQIGQLPLIVEVAGQKVEFLEWKATDVTATKLIGFTIHAPSQFRFTVEAGDLEFPAASDWLHPAGVIGPRVKAIQALTVCAG